MIRFLIELQNFRAPHRPLPYRIASRSLARTGIHRQRWLCSCALVVGALGCEPEDPILARVGDRVITAADLGRFVERLPEGLRSEREGRDAQLEYLRSAIDQELMLLEAGNRGVDTVTAVRRTLERNLRKELADRYQRETIVPHVEVTAAEIERAFAERGFSRERLLSRLLVYEEEELAEVQRALKQGDSFEELAERYSHYDRVAPKSGLVGWIGLSQAEGRFLISKSEFLSLPDGEVAAPNRLGNSWQFFRFVDSRRAEFEKYQDEVERLVTQEKWRARVAEETEVLSRTFGARLHPEGLRIVLSPGQPIGKLKLSAEQSSQLFYTFDGGELTVAEFVGILRSDGFGRRTFEDSTQLVGFAEQVLLHSMIFERAARDKGWHEEPEFVDRAHRERKKFLLSHLTREEDEKQGQPTKEEIRAYYEANRRRFMTREKVHVEEITSPTEDEAAHLRSEIEGGVGIAKLLERGGTSTHGNDSTGVLVLGPRMGRRLPDLFAAVLQAGEGDVGGPVQIQDGFSVFRVLKREERELLSFEKARERAERMLRAQRREEVIQAFIKSLRDKYSDQIEVFEEFL